MMQNVRRNILCNALIVAIGATCAVSNTQAQAAGGMKNFDVPAQSAASALNAFAEQADITLVFSQDSVAGIVLGELDGTYSIDGALERLLAGTGLVWGTNDTGAIAISRSDQAAETGAVVNIDGVTVLAVRGRPRTVANSPVPIDVFSAEDIESIPHTDTNDLLATLIPSYTVNRNSNSDGDTSVRPPSLRGLPGNKTLMLVNSKRRHRSASVPNSGFGSQSSDAALIPQLALRSVEVLRDGAAAQYGSDAIAGVINFLLKEDASGGEFVVQSGQYYEGDGLDYSIAGNVGLPLGERGFLNLTAEYVDMDWTHRGTQFRNAAFDAIEYAAANPDYAAAVDLSQPLQRTGQPDMDALRTFFNAGYQLINGAELYAFGSYANSEIMAHGGYRYPANGQAVLDNPVRLEDGTVFRFNEIFPGGFRPEYTGVIRDYSLVAGTRFDIADVDYDVGISYGNNDFGYKLNGVPNPSLGPDTPTSFRPGSTISDEIALNFDGVTDILPTTFHSPVTLNFGLEYRNEGFEIKPGDPASAAAGPWAFPDPFGFCNDDHTPSALAPSGVGLNCANYVAGDADGFPGIDPVYTVLDSGSAGIPGTSPDYTGDYNRESYSAYLEGTADITENLFLDIAGRFEDYADFGSRFSGKAAFLYKVNDIFNIRGSFGTGFRAPSIGQIYLTNVRVTFLDGEAIAVGTFPAVHPASSFLGAAPLRPETSENVSIGFTARLPSGLNLTLDAYRINIEDTIYMTPLITVSDSIREQLVAANVPGALSITRMRFFQNAFKSTTSGVDLVAQYATGWGNGSSTTFSAAFNYNKYEVKNVDIAGLFNDVAIFNFENSMPDWRGTLSANHSFGPWSALARINLTGPYEYQRTTAPFPAQEYDTEAMLDLELSYAFGNSSVVSIGGRNVTDNYPDRDNIGSVTNGVVYRDGPLSYQGGYYYLRFKKSF